MEVTVTKSKSVRNAERSRATRAKAKMEPKSTQELVNELALFREQTVDFFVKVRGLQSAGLNPKSVVDTAVVTAEDLEEVWGKVSTYRTTNTKLHPETRQELISLYGKIYGTEDVPNNEFMLWGVKGFILECKGEDVDWATAAASTAREKADRCQREFDKSRLPHSGNSNGVNSQGSGGVSSGSQPNYSFANKGGKPSTKLGNGKRAPSRNLTKFSSGLSQERHLVSQSDLAAVQDVLQSEIELLDTANRKVFLLGEARKKEADRIIGLRYSMDDRKSAPIESEESVKVIESTLLSMEAEISRSTQVVITLPGNGAANADGEALLLQLNTLKVERERNVRKLEIAKFALEENNRRATQGEEMYHNAEIELWKSNSDFTLLERQIAEMVRRRAAIEDQIQSMKAGSGVSLWPQPVSRAGNEWDDTHFELQPCSFCSGYFSAFDIVVASCRHMYHPFCIASVCSKQNRCVTCGKLFHPSWWRSFGFEDSKLELQDTAVELDLSKMKEDTKLSCQDDSGLQVKNWSEKQSDLGSSGSTFQGFKDDTEPQATVMPSVSEDPENGITRTIASEEVNSPVKKSRLQKSPVKKSVEVNSPSENLPFTGIFDSTSLVDALSFDAHPSSTVVPLPVVIVSAEEEDFQEEDNSIDVEGKIIEDQPIVLSLTDPRGALGKAHRYSFSTRRESGPLDEDVPSCKTISLAVVCPVVNPTLTGLLNSKAPKRKGIHKLEEDVSRKTHSRRNDNKNKANEVFETTAETTRGRVTRSTAKPTH